MPDLTCASMQDDRKRAALNRLRTIRGHVDGIIRMVEQDEYCVEVLKQLSAVQASLERVNRLVLRNHLETCFITAVREGRSEAAIAEVVDAVKFTPALTGPARRSAVAEPASIAGPAL